MSGLPTSFIIYLNHLCFIDVLNPGCCSQHHSNSSSSIAYVYLYYKGIKKGYATDHHTEQLFTMRPTPKFRKKNSCYGTPDFLLLTFVVTCLEELQGTAVLYIYIKKKNKKILSIGGIVNNHITCFEDYLIHTNSLINITSLYIRPYISNASTTVFGFEFINCCDHPFLLGSRKNHGMTPPVHSGAKDNVRLLLIKNPAHSFSNPWCLVHGTSFERFPRR